MALTRRNILIGGGAGIGLVVTWAAWPRHYPVTLVAGPGEAVLGAFVKVGGDGQVTVAVAQTEHGQGIYTALAQIVADELGADWRIVGVEPSPLGAPYTNPLAVEALTGGTALLPEGVRNEHWRRAGAMLTVASTSVSAWEAPLRQAGAAARVLLCRAAARRWDAEWRDCETADGFVVLGDKRARFAELAVAAAAETLPSEDLPLRIGDEHRLTGRALSRLDAPAKVDGSVDYAGDVRLSGLVFASVRQGPAGSRLVRVDRAAVERVRGVVAVVENERWVAAVASDGWAALRAVDALAPRFSGGERRTNLEQALAAALTRPGERAAAIGDIEGAFASSAAVRADYAVAPALHPAVETPAAAAQWLAGRLELWLATDAPMAARAAAAAAIGVAPDAVIVHRMQVGGSFGAALESDVAAQAAVLAVKLERPVQLAWSRLETLRHDRPRAPALARMEAALDAAGTIRGWRARIAAPATGAELARRVLPGDQLLAAEAWLPAGADGYATAGAVPPYRLPALRIDHHHADLGFATGHLRGGAHGYTAFFTESFIDELAHRAGAEPMSYRMALLAGGGDQVRLARCLSTAAALGGWQGGAAGSGQGIACHSLAGSHIAVVAEAAVSGGRIEVSRLAAAADVGRAINPDLVRQQIEGGLILGAALATGCEMGAERFGDLALPTLATAPEITLDLIESDAEPGGASDLGVGVVAPAIANALRGTLGTRARRLPLRVHA